MKKFFTGIFLLFISMAIFCPVLSAAEQQSVSYPDDVNAQDIAEDEYTEDIDVEQMYRDMPVPEFKYVHNIDPGEYQDTMYSTCLLYTSPSPRD